MMTFQHYWRCAHHLSAIDNFFEKRTTCEWQCHETSLKSTDLGVHRQPKSWSAPRGSNQWAELQRNGL